MENTIIDRPMLMRGDMVRATFAGRKRHTRRVVKDTMHPDTAHFVRQENYVRPDGTCVDLFLPRDRFGRSLGPGIICPYGKPGDRLWVREAWGLYEYQEHAPGGFSMATGETKIVYRADKAGRSPSDDRWRPSIHMPRWASRLTLEVASVRVERVQDISEADAIAEGIEQTSDRLGPLFSAPNSPKSHRTAGCAFAGLWDSINAKRGFGWDVNPWVFVIEFRRVAPDAAPSPAEGTE